MITGMIWRDMNTAPLDGTLVELYVREEVNRHLFRESNCFFDSTENDWFLVRGKRYLKELGWIPVKWHSIPKPPDDLSNKT